tara:strand:+ start:1188 stop:2234 length:1047 start_codon:yes stop_codon:yes gene_type:complete
MTSNKKELLKLYKAFHLIRYSQEYLIEKYHPEDLMRCPIHFCLGQEALASAASLFLKKEDYLLSHHRSHGYYLAKNCPIEAMIAEFYGKQTGSNFGLAGSQELSYSKLNFFSGTILSGMFSISLGTAFKNKLDKKNITMTVIGDGGMEEGIVYETLNIASLMSLPILFVCENNRFSVHTNMKERTKVQNFKKIAESFNIDYLKISDHKILKILSNTEKAFKFVRNKRKPLFLEYDTMRTCGHVGPENDDKEHNYRNSYLKTWSKRNTNNDFLKLLKKKFGKNEIEKIEKANKEKVHLAVSSAKKDPFLNFDDCLRANFKVSYSKLVKKFSEDNNDFKSDQAETKLNPY